MAANNFATMLHRNTNKTTLVLVYAFLEWILIILLLLNSLFSYLIIKFADYFGLKRPCIWCCRIDHIIEPQNSKNYCRDLVCEAHAFEISKLGYCYNHRKLAESENMCENCSSSSSFSSSSQPDYIKFSKSFGLFPWMKRNIATGCSCCGVHLDSRFYRPSFVVMPSPMQNMITQDEGDDNSDHSRSDSAFGHHEDGQNTEENKKTTHMVPSVGEQDSNKHKDGQPKEMPPQHLEFFIHGDNCRLIPVELVDSSAAAAAARENRNPHQYKLEEDEDVILDFDMLAGGGEEAEPILENWHVSGDTVTVFSGHESREKSSSVLQDGENLEQNHQDVNIGPTFEDPTRNHNVEDHVGRREGGICSDVSQASEEATEMQGDEFEAEVSVGTEIPDQEHVDEYHIQVILLEDSGHHIQEDPSRGSVGFHARDKSGGVEDEEQFEEFKTMSIETSIAKVPNDHLESSMEFNENEEEKIPDTPPSVDNLHHLHKKLLLLERRENSGTEESLDESVVSDIESGEITIEKLKSALKAERKAISTLYVELEEERNASAVAANQTMAMINRLQEEKAAMQMEALQYQRLMEEQSEYDQEALQLLNELMVKRGNENQELEKELEFYRKKVREFEVKEKLVVKSRSRTNSSVSCSNGEDSDGASSIDLNHEAKGEINGFYSHQNNTNTHVDAVLYLEESLANFEEERLSILEQLKVLEEKLFMLNYEEEEEEEHVCYENGNGLYHNHVNGFANGHSHTKEINGGRKIMGPEGKRLLPLFDAIGIEEDGVLSGEEKGMDLNSFEKFLREKTEFKEKKRVGLEEEVDNVFERLQALEADREFLENCIRSLRKGDKGIHILQEILQHLRDLRNVEQRVRNMDDLAL